MKNKKLLLVDLDDTLIDTKSLKLGLFSDISQVFLTYISQVEKIYEATKSARHNMWTEFFRKILDINPSKKHELETLIDNNLKKTGIHSKAVVIVKKFKGKKALFSFGETSFQNKKIDILNLTNLFDEIIVTQKPKIEFFRKHANKNKLKVSEESYSDITVMDDHAVFLEQLKTEFPWVKIIDAKELVS